MFVGGANVLIGENISVDDYSTIIMGSVVLTNIKKTSSFRNPAKIIKKMGKDIFNFEKTLLDLEIRGEIFQPNLTTKLSIETAIEK